MILVLASSSPTRRRVLAEAGVRFEAIVPKFDERAAERLLIEAGAAPGDLAQALAMGKAIAASGDRPDDLVIGADQMLDIDGERLTKPDNMEEARRQLLRLAGRTHLLHSAIACARAGEIVWKHVETPLLTMRALAPAEIGRYLAEVGEAALGSVGAYQIEGPGIRLFEAIDGDYFAVLGLPLLPLLKFLRAQGLIE